jgi:hypothetical protein
MGSRGLLRPFSRGRRARLSRGGERRLFVERDRLPDGRVAIPVAQGIQGHLHAVMASEGIVIQPLEDLHHRLHWDASGDRRAGPRVGRQAEQPPGVEASLPVVDDGRLDIQERGHTARAEAHLQQLDDPPAGLLLGRLFPIGTEPGEEGLRTQGLGQTLRSGGGLPRERRRLVQMEGRERRLLGFLATVLQDVGREVRPREHPTDPSVIH